LQSEGSSVGRGVSGRRWLAGALGLGVLLIAAGSAYYGVTRHTEKQMAMTLTGGDPDKAPVLLRRYGCGGCHTISALKGADGKVAPPLDHLRQRVYIAGGLQNTADNLVHWIVTPESIRPGSAMPNSGITEPEARDVAAFLYAN
jgi:cytochrome c2